MIVIALAVPFPAYLGIYYGLRLSGVIVESRGGFYAWVNPQERFPDIDRAKNRPKSGFFKLAIWTEQQLPVQLEAVGVRRQDLEWSLRLEGGDADPMIRQFVKPQGWILSGAISEASTYSSRGSGEIHEYRTFRIAPQDVDGVVESMRCRYIGRRHFEDDNDPWTWREDENGIELDYYINDGVDTIWVWFDGRVHWNYQRM